MSASRSSVSAMIEASGACAATADRRPAESPRKTDRLADQTICCTRIATVLGDMIAAATDTGICLLEFEYSSVQKDNPADSGRLLRQLRLLEKRHQRRLIDRRHPHLTLLRKELKRYLAGNAQSFTVPLDYKGTTFQQAVWSALQQVGYGQSISYRELADHVGRPQAIRAVGAANGANPLAIVIPCHRIIGSTGDLTGYGGGVQRKQWLLSLEAGERKKFKPDGSGSNGSGPNGSGPNGKEQPVIAR